MVPAEMSTRAQLEYLRNDSTTDAPDHQIKYFGEGAEIRPFFQAMLAEFGKPGMTFSMKLQSVVSEFFERLCGLASAVVS
jgi:hypothetical protein